MYAEQKLEEYFKLNSGGQVYSIYKAYILEQKQFHEDHLVNELGETLVRWRQGRIQQLNDMLNLIKVKS